MFSVVVLAGVLWGLSFEIVEDGFVNLIYTQLFGWGVFLKALLVATVAILPASVAFVLLAPFLFQSYLPFVEKGGAVLLMALGIGWLVFAWARKETETEEARKASGRKSGNRGRIVLATQLVAVEEAEIVVVLIPVVLAAHAFEAVVAALVGVSAALGAGWVLRRRLARIVEGRLRYLKTASGVGLLFLGLVLLST